MFVWRNDPTVANPAPPVQIPVPFLANAAGAGDVLAKAFEYAGVQRIPGFHLCSPCQRRQEALNQLLQFKPWGNW